MQAYGEPLPATTTDGEGLSHLFPVAGAARHAPISRRSACPAARAMAVTSLAQAIAADPAIFSRGASLEDAIAKLRALPGIGEWTAQYIAMRELREPDAFPAADIGLLRAMADGRRASPVAVPNCCPAPSAGGRGAPMRRCICGPREFAAALSGKIDEREAA